MSGLGSALTKDERYDDVFDAKSGDELNGVLRSLGAVNARPPLPHTPYVKIKKTGRILPWNPLLADQGELVENCDVNGNTDPNAWKDSVVTEGGELSPEELALYSSKIMEQATHMQEGFKQTYVAPAIHPVEQQEPKFHTFNDVESLRALLGEKA